MDMAGGGVTRRDFHEALAPLGAFGLRVGAAGMKMTTRWRIDGAGRIAAEDNAFPFPMRIGFGHGGEQ